MAIRNIVKDGDPILLKQTRKVENFDSKLHALLDDMYDTLVEANGVGIAAPQVGIMRSICLVDTGDGLLELINPEIIETSGTQNDPEGCLSFPGVVGLVERPNYVKVKAQDRNGKWYEAEGEELTARAFSHEIDHLNGVVFTSKISEMIDPKEYYGDNEDEE